MKCRYCDSELGVDKYFDNAMYCHGCKARFIYKDDFEDRIVSIKNINGTTYSIVYVLLYDTTYVYKKSNLICLLDGEHNPKDIIKRIDTIKVFS